MYTKMTLQYNEEEKSFDINSGDWPELAQYIEDAEELLYDSVNDMWEIDGVRFAGEWITNQVIQMTHTLNVIAHMNLRRGVLVGKSKMANRLMQIQKGEVPGLPEKET